MSDASVPPPAEKSNRFGMDSNLAGALCWKRQRDVLQTLVILTCVIGFSIIANTSGGPVRLWGIQLPELCGFRLITGFDCPGCGITRALILAFEGKFYHSYLMHIWGIPLAAFLLFQICGHLVGLSFRMPSPPQISFLMRRWSSTFILLSLMLPWAVKTAILAVIRFL